MAIEKKHIAVIALFIGCLSTNAQNLGKALDGKVQSEDKDVSGVHVLNVTTDKTTITDGEGYFSIPVHLNDTLLFSAVQFKRKILIVIPAVLESTLVYVPLEEFMNELDEVVVQPYNLSGDVSRDVDKMDVGPIITETTLDLPNAHTVPPTQNERKLYTARTWEFTGSSVKLDPLINYFSGRTKRLKKRVKRDKKYKELENVHAAIPDSLFIHGLGIPEDNIMDFLFFCETDKSFYTLAEAGNTFGIWQLLQNKSAVYRENNGLD